MRSLVSCVKLDKFLRCKIEKTEEKEIKRSETWQRRMSDNCIPSIFEWSTMFFIIHVSFQFY